MDELKACPFCGKPFEIIESPMYGYMVRHNTGCAFYSDGETGSIYANKQELIDDLNRRPLEDALQAEIELLREALEEIRDLARTGLPPAGWEETYWLFHKSNRIAGMAAATLKGQDAEGKTNGHAHRSGNKCTPND